MYHRIIEFLGSDGGNKRSFATDRSLRVPGCFVASVAVAAQRFMNNDLHTTMLAFACKVDLVGSRRTQKIVLPFFLAKKLNCFAVLDGKRRLA